MSTGRRALALLPPDSQQYAIVQQQIAAAGRPADPAVRARPTRPGAVMAASRSRRDRHRCRRPRRQAQVPAARADQGEHVPLDVRLLRRLLVDLRLAARARARRSRSTSTRWGTSSVLRRLGIAAGAPLFIPGRRRARHAEAARRPIRSPTRRSGSPVRCGALVQASPPPRSTRRPACAIWLAIAELTGFINLFNLIPVWQLDGSRGFHALSQSQRWLVVAAVVVALLLTGAADAVPRRRRRACGARCSGESGPGDTRTLATFVVLLFALSALARGVR